MVSAQKCSLWPWAVPSLLFSVYRGAYSLSVSWSVHEAYCLSPSNVSVMNELCSSVGRRACTGSNLPLYLHLVWYIWGCLCFMKFRDDCFLPIVDLQSLFKLCYCAFLAVSLFFVTQWSYVVHEVIMKDM